MMKKDIKNWEILIIDDEQELSSMMKDVLEEEKYQVICAFSGPDGIALNEQKKPDLILLDLDLPDIHGNIVLIQLKANPKTRNIPVVVISADALPKQIEQMLQAGAMDYLTKPFDVDEFIKMLENGIKFHT